MRFDHELVTWVGSRGMKSMWFVNVCAISDSNKKRQAKEDGKTDTQTLASTKKCYARPWRLEAILLQSSFHRTRVVARLGLVHRGEVTVESYQTHAIAGTAQLFRFFSRGPIKSREFWEQPRVLGGCKVFLTQSAPPSPMDLIVRVPVVRTLNQEPSFVILFQEYSPVVSPRTSTWGNKPLPSYH